MTGDVALALKLVRDGMSIEKGIAHSRGSGQAGISAPLFGFPRRLTLYLYMVDPNKRVLTCLH